MGGLLVVCWVRRLQVSLFALSGLRTSHAPSFIAVTKLDAPPALGENALPTIRSQGAQACL